MFIVYLTIVGAVWLTNYSSAKAYVLNKVNLCKYLSLPWCKDTVAGLWIDIVGSLVLTSVVVKTFLGLETKTETLDIRSRDRDLDKMNSSLETMVSKSHHWLHQFQLVTEHLLKGATNYGNRSIGIGTKHPVLRPRPRPGSSGLETKTETLDFRSRDRDLGLQVSRPRPRPWPSCLETETESWTKWTRVHSRPWSRDHHTGSYVHLKLVDAPTHQLNAWEHKHWALWEIN